MREILHVLSFIKNNLQPDDQRTRFKSTELDVPCTRGMSWEGLASLLFAYRLHQTRWSHRFYASSSLSPSFRTKEECEKRSQKPQTLDSLTFGFSDASVWKVVRTTSYFCKDDFFAGLLSLPPWYMKTLKISPSVLLSISAFHCESKARGATTRRG